MQACKADTPLIVAIENFDLVYFDIIFSNLFLISPFPVVDTIPSLRHLFKYL